MGQGDVMRIDLTSLLEALTEPMSNKMLSLIGLVIVMFFMVAAFLILSKYAHRHIGTWKSADNHAVIEFHKDGHAKFNDAPCSWEADFLYSRFTLKCTTRAYDVSLDGDLMQVGHLKFERSL